MTSFHSADGTVDVSARRYRYNGKERDEETGLYYYGARYYAAWLGRWTAVDPKGLVNGTNVYAYVKNNPIKFNDPTGKQTGDVQVQHRRRFDAPIHHEHGRNRSVSEPGGRTRASTTSQTGRSAPPTSATDEKARETKWTTVETPYGKLQVPQAMTEQQVQAGERGPAVQVEQPYVPKPIHTVPDPVGAPGLAESFVPVWGPGRTAIDELQRGHAAQGVFWSAMAVSDLFIVKGLAAGAVRGVGRLLFKEALEHVEAQAAERTMQGVAQTGLRESQHFIELGTDAAHGGEFVRSQAIGGRAIEEHLGREISAGTHPGVDFVDKELGDISLKGPLPEHGDPAGLARSAITDVTRNTATQTLFVDLQGLAAEQATMVEQLVRAGTAGATKRIIFLR